MIRTRFAVASLWLVLVLFLGSADFAAQETGRFVVPVLKLLVPGAPFAQLQAIHLVLRKLAHVAEYAVLALLWFRAVHCVAGRTPRTAAWVALSICLVCAFADEAHQSMLPSRHGSARDVLIDAFGATAMLTIARGRQTMGNRGGPLGDAVAAEPAD
jgi:VanZ family protein